jgi:hypothetical protein
LDRPNADISAPWQTTARARAESEAGRDEGYLDWLSTRFSSRDWLDQPAPVRDVPPSSAQFTFGF